MTYRFQYVWLLLTGICSCSGTASVQEEKRIPTYVECLAHIQTTQLSYAQSWKQTSRKDTLLKSAAGFLQTTIVQKLFRYWEGTPWNFYGATNTPQQGTIACGYFVTTLLRDAGVKLDRNGLAQDYSENLIKKLVNKNHIKKYVPFNLTSYLKQIEAGGDQLYIIGLDFHVGFISVEKGEAWFVHSKYTDPAEVIRERAAESNILANNHYTVTGCLTSDTTFLRKWCTGTAF